MIKQNGQGIKADLVNVLNHTYLKNQKKKKEEIQSFV